MTLVCAMGLLARTTDLGGVWEFRLIPKSRGEPANWFAVDAKGTWTPIRVPGSYDEALRNNVLYGARLGIARRSMHPSTKASVHFCDLTAW